MRSEIKSTLRPLPHPFTSKPKTIRASTPNIYLNRNILSNINNPKGIKTPKSRTPTATSRETSIPLTINSTFEPYILSNQSGIYSDDITGNIIYQRKWSQVILGSTSGLIFVLVIAVMYSLYVLCLPYGDSISFGILLSIILHPRSREQYSNSKALKLKCIKKMKEVQDSWSAKSKLYGIIGSLISLHYFFSFALLEGVIILGLNKLSLGKRFHKVDNKQKKEKNYINNNDKYINDTSSSSTSRNNNKETLMSTSKGRFILRTLTACIFLFVAHSMIGISFFLGMHFILFILFSLSVILMPGEKFIKIMWRLWQLSLVLFFTIALSYNLALDVISISDAVKRTTSAMVNVQKQWNNIGNEKENYNKSFDIITSSKESSTFYGSEFQEFIIMKLQQTLLKELADILNHTNATEFATAVRQGLTPVLSTFPSQISIGSLKNKSTEIYTSLFVTGGDPLLKVDWVSVLQKLMERWQPFFAFSGHVLLKLASNLMGFLDNIYACMLFFCVFHYFLQLDHTILYYIMAKMLKVMHPRGGERHAREVEREITVSFLTLLQSFWHLSWFHFSITFCLYYHCGFPAPLLSGLIASLIAIFPILPKWLSPVALAAFYSGLQVLHQHGLWGLLFINNNYYYKLWGACVAFIISTGDEWLLSVSRGLRGGNSVISNNNNNNNNSGGITTREQLPTFVIGTALVLGYVKYGIRGILLGPMTVIVAKVLFDNWDIVSEREVVSEEQQQQQKEREEE